MRSQNPSASFPCMEKHRHLRAHQKLAEASGHASVVCVNGMMLDLSGNAPKVVEYVETGRVYLDGTVQYGALDGIMRERIKNGDETVCACEYQMDDEDDFFAEPWVEIRGFPQQDALSKFLRISWKRTLASFWAERSRKRGKTTMP